MKKVGDGRRVQKVEKEIQAVVGMYLISGFSEPLDVFVTLSRVVVSADLKSGKIYFTVLPKGASRVDVVDEDAIQETEDMLNSHVSEVQQHIAKELKLRFTPKIRFFHDKSVDKVRKVDQILSEISNQNKRDND
ncbi:MAG: 30S ribosome-binding factor RbfA [Bdellovibrionaceae bacterium]|nr:30S ribosome-binding factor RbfA [Pseudobdellovibrionaceae bacterium]